MLCVPPSLGEVTDVGASMSDLWVDLRSVTAEVVPSRNLGPASVVEVSPRPGVGLPEASEVCSVRDVGEEVR